MKVLQFTAKQVLPANAVETFETSEVITFNFRKKEFMKSVETNNETGRVISSLEVGDHKAPFMGEGMLEITNLLLKKVGNQ